LTAAPLPPAPGATPQQVLPNIRIDNGYYQLSISNQGATVRGWVLPGFKGNDGKALQLLNTVGEAPPVFSLYFPTLSGAERDTVSKAVNWSYYQPTVDPDGLGVTYEFSNGHLAAKKVFRFAKNSYVAHVTTEVTMDGKPIRHMIEWRGGFGDLTLPAPAVAEKSAYFDVANNKLVEQTAKDASNGPASSSGSYSFAGVTDTYFAAVFLPKTENGLQTATFSDTVPTELEPKPSALTGVAVGEATDINDFRLFVGPKDVDTMKKIDPKLEQLVDFGWMSILAKPLFYAVNYVNDAFVHNFGWAIIVVTIVLNMALFPLKFTSMKSMRKMQALKPQVDAINEKYKGVSMRDPKAAEKTQETMDLYKRHGVNPMGGCLPMALQFPILIAFYKVFAVSVEMRGASWLWITDLSQAEHLPIHILPIILVASQFLMQKMMPQPGVDPSQQKMTQFMPLIFGLMFYKLSSGLVLYYLTSNLVNMAQQWFFNHTDTARVAAASVQPAPKKKK
jgi:YidC/Oxa1 family membrane protein insertase